MEQQNVLSDLVIDSVGVEQIRSFAGWAKFLSIIGFIMCGLIAIVGLFAGTIFSTLGGYNRYGGGSMAGIGAIMTVIYIILAVIYFLPTLFLYQSATKLKSAVVSSDQMLLNEGFTKLKASFRFVGILTIILLSIYTIILLFALIATTMR
jgi:preprotein translocase subunit SecG